MDYGVYFGKEQVGKVQVQRQGLYYRFTCRCRISGDVMCRLWVSSGEKRENLGLFNRIAQVIAKKPRYSYIELDDFGSFVWKQIDGKRTIYEIGQLVHDEFGDKAEPLYNRLVGFIRTLHENRFVVYANKIKKD